MPESSSSSTSPSHTLKQQPLTVASTTSGTNIVAREHPRVELQPGDEVFAPDDARAMSPRRSSESLEKLAQETRAELNEFVLLSCFASKLLISL
jgi:hypothetical protein